ncbi:MAG: hypothetical protein U0Y82_16795 [Thermoleophilia bacterium]
MNATLGMIRITGHALAALLSYLGAWREVTVPTVLVLAAAQVVGPLGLLAGLVVLIVALVFLADHGRGLSLDALMRNAGDALERCRRRHLALRVRRRWPALCRELGWDTAEGRTPTTSTGRPDETRRQRPRQPALRHVEALAGTLRVCWRPRGDVSPGKWQEHAEGLGRQLGAHSVRVAELPGEPGTLAATFGMTPLPVRDAVAGPVGEQAQAPPLGPERQVVHQVEAPALRLELGQRAGGGIAAWVPAEVNGLLITGSTGGGKGGAVRCLVSQVLERGAVVHLLDGKGTGEYRWIGDAGGFVYRDVHSMLAALQSLGDELRNRCDDLHALGAASVLELPPRLRPGPILVVMDEAGDVLTLRKTTEERNTDAIRGQLGVLLTQLAQQGRAALIHVAVSLQRADVQALGPSGGALRSNLVARLVVGTTDADGLDAGLGTGHRDLLVHSPAPRVAPWPSR